MKYKNENFFSVGWGDCSPSGAVFYPNYFRWFDAAMWQFFDNAGWPLKELEAKFGIVGLPLITTSAEFKASCRLHDQVTLTTQITSFSTKTVYMSHLLTKNEKLVVEAKDVRFWGVRDIEDNNKLKAKPIPQEVIDYFSN